ncbi:transcriptional corepressor LEUNIG_HOMOLOG-like [Actinidia eriantha]|uniref:transcriptional corepressor LEUNIG_HOMOLOG-like n=1 Tax=Actinidia eriantha TaxID=165200 RepID=UPI00258CA58E|nr:transcriptional corepressor LEUNIG_HOMOLOG-like [Actinidia eriantha]XP_057483730.1 transcriptional corepressor LEUNIG_HOMOLOG-like [Actinidia eriantha]XP_057483731.1 transcriptional corepressor LEUNIG_HOMOLOG-like [Actinidia eriantha]
MAQSNWEADKMLDVYIHDYLLKRKLHNSAKTFMTEGKVATDPVAIDAPGGFLFEWWSVFWDIFIARTNEKHSEAAAAYIETQQIKAREQQQQLQMHQLQLMQQQRNVQLQQRDPNHPPLGSPINAINSDGMMGQPSASVLAMKMYEERMKHPHSMDSDASPAIIDANRMALLKSATNHQGQLTQSNSGNMSAALQQMQGRTQLTADIKPEVNLGAPQKSLPMDPSSIYGQAILQSKSGLGGAGLNQGITGLPLKGWPLTGIDQLRQVQKPNLLTQNQFLLASQQQQVLAQAQAQGSLGSSPNIGFSGLQRGSLNVKDGQPMRNDGSICSPPQSNSPKMKMAQMQQSSSQQQDQLQQQQLQQNNRKRKQHSSSGPANSTGTGNTVGPSPNSPASTHTPGDGITTTSGLQHVNSASKSLMMYGTDGAGLASSTNHLEDIEHFGDVGSLDDNMDSFLTHDGGDGRDPYGTLKQGPTDHKTEASKGFSFGEVGCIKTRNKVTCCHFSSDGKLLASAGHDKKAVLWNMDTLQTESTPEEHQYLITDVRFRPNSTQLATASFDKSVRLWDAANPSYCLHAYTGHSYHVMSLDFHPKKTDLFCFCDSNNEIHYWNTSPFTCTRISKQGGSAQVRFQPISGHVLAAASDKVISIFDVETNRQTHSFQGHSGVVNYLCWDLNGDYLASVSEESVKVWSLTSGECIHDFISSNGNQFHSCVFHPSYSALLVIGGLRSLELWNMAENKSMTVQAHENIIAALAQSPITGMVASSSHDSSVKLWK